MPVGVQGHLADRQAEMVQHEQLREPGQGRPTPRPAQGRRQLIQCPPGGVSERFKVRLSKSRVAATPPRVRISPPPPSTGHHRDQRSMRQAIASRIIVVAVYALAMGYLEAVVVYYIRYALGDVHATGSVT